MSTGVVAALGAEARTLGTSKRRSDGLSSLADGTLVAVSGMGGEAASAAARVLAAAGVDALVCWGLAGGLDPTAGAGTVFLPSVVISRDGASFSTDRHWRRLISAALSERRRVLDGKLLTNRRPIDDVAGKAAAFRDTGAAAVDMESILVAEVAAGLGLPFVAVRVIVDTASDHLPQAVMDASTGGQVSMLRLVRGVLRSPREVAPLLRLAKRYRAAMSSLSAVARTGTLARVA